jgi:hypothetical protein
MSLKSFLKKAIRDPKVQKTVKEKVVPAIKKEYEKRKEKKK